MRESVNFLAFFVVRCEFYIYLCKQKESRNPVSLEKSNVNIKF